jgi:hypothetical protein
MTEETKRCPKCGGEGVPIIYGLVPLEQFPTELNHANGAILAGR